MNPLSFCRRVYFLPARRVTCQNRVPCEPLRFRAFGSGFEPSSRCTVWQCTKVRLRLFISLNKFTASSVCVVSRLGKPNGVSIPILWKVKIDTKKNIRRETKVSTVRAGADVWSVKIDIEPETHVLSHMVASCKRLSRSRKWNFNYALKLDDPVEPDFATKEKGAKNAWSFQTTAGLFGVY